MELSEKALVKLAHERNQPEVTVMNNRVDQEILNWLINMPEGDPNFRSNLARANEVTIRYALEQVSNVVGKKVVEIALKRQLKKLLEAQGEQTAASETRQTRAVALDVTTLQAERDQQVAVQEEQRVREKAIAQCHEVIGQIKGFKVIAKFADVGNLVWLRQVKESKIYKNLSDIGTWDKFCEYIGLSRSKVDEDLANLAIFGESFLADVGKIGLGYRELRQLRQLKYDGESFSMSDDGKTVIIEGETISLGEDAGSEIEAALEKLLEKNKTLRERNGKLEKDLRGAVKEETATLASEINTYKARVKDLEQYEPKTMDETRFQAQFDEIHANMSRLAASIRTVIAMEDLQEYPGVMARVDGYVEGCNYLNDELRGLWADHCMFENK
jgi:hypothetical protein